MGLLITGCLFASSVQVQGAEETTKSGSHGSMTMTFSADDAMFLPGVGAMVVATDGKLRVDFIAPPEQRDQAYREVDIQEGDVLMMVNGKRVKSIEKLRELFEGLEVGAEIKLGLKRDKSIVIASFAKPDDSQMGGMVMMMTQDVEEGQDGGPATITTKTMSFGGNDNMVPLIGLGIMLTNSDGSLKVGPRMQIQGRKVPEVDLQPEDIILSINDQAVNSAKQFSPVYDAIPDGEQVSLKIKRGDETLAITFVKPASPGMGGMKIIKKSGK